jgi:hypothetical protein
MKEAAAVQWESSADSDKAQRDLEKVEQVTSPKTKVRKQKKRTKVEYNRRTIEIHPEIEKMLDKMQYDLRLRSHTEVMQKAIQLMGVVLGIDGSGKKKIYIERSDGKLQELLII